MPVPNSESFTRIAMGVAPIFLARGYRGVSLRALADDLGIKAASLYHHCPGGKAELYVRSLTVYLRDYQHRLEEAPGRARFPNAVFRMADWMLEHPPVDMQHILRVDLPHLEPGAAEQLVTALHEAVLAPLARVFEEARAVLRRSVEPGLAASAVLALVEGLGFSHLPPGGSPSPTDLAAARKMVHAGLSMLLDGAREASA